eukprot:TRINITY_DN8460_c1_g1_i6.p1 TRINITY_DN8460_c1_g1~~TRINITY_DN8460_c1_g1_i6.p1  ORF type:complete len:595 (+),score=115.10 TRINITY_DN8460_c1_g1_i6:550-2334(+)
MASAAGGTTGGIVFQATPEPSGPGIYPCPGDAKLERTLDGLACMWHNNTGFNMPPSYQVRAYCDHFHEGYFGYFWEVAGAGPGPAGLPPGAWPCPDCATPGKSEGAYWCVINNGSCGIVLTERMHVLCGHLMQGTFGYVFDPASTGAPDTQAPLPTPIPTQPGGLPSPPPTPAPPTPAPATPLPQSPAPHTPGPRGSPPSTESLAPVLPVSIAAAGFLLLFLCIVLRCIRRPRPAPPSEADGTTRGLLLHRYEILSQIGGGAFGDVHLVRRRSDGEMLALKEVVCGSAAAVDNALFEFRTVAKLQGHPNMIRIVESFMSWENQDSGSSQPGSSARSNPPDPVSGDSDKRAPLIDSQEKGSDESNGRRRQLASPRCVCLIMPYYGEGDLRAFVMRHSGPIPERLLLSHAGQLSSLLEYLHRRQPPLIHRDLKPENVLTADGGETVVVTDFGLAKVLARGDLHQTRAGTVAFMAPECFEEVYGVEVDMWALGCVLYAVATRRIEASSVPVMFLEAQRPQFEQTIRDDLVGRGYSSTLAGLVVDLLCVDRVKRLSASAALLRLGVKPHSPDEWEWCESYAGSTQGGIQCGSAEQVCA